MKERKKNRLLVVQLLDHRCCRFCCCSCCLRRLCFVYFSVALQFIAHSLFSHSIVKNAEQWKKDPCTRTRKDYIYFGSSEKLVFTQINTLVAKHASSRANIVSITYCVFRLCVMLHCWRFYCWTTIKWCTFSVYTYVGKRWWLWEYERAEVRDNDRYNIWYHRIRFCAGAEFFLNAMVLWECDIWASIGWDDGKMKPKRMSSSHTPHKKKVLLVMCKLCVCFQYKTSIIIIFCCALYNQSLFLLLPHLFPLYCLLVWIWGIEKYNQRRLCCRTFDTICSFEMVFAVNLMLRLLTFRRCWKNETIFFPRFQML